MAEVFVDVAYESTSQEILSKLNEGGTSVIKSIQRGVAKGSASKVSITISSVNPDKCFVLMHNELVAHSAGSGSGGDTCGAYLISLTTNNLEIKAPMYNSGFAYTNFSWQLIEFC